MKFSLKLRPSKLAVDEISISLAILAVIGATSFVMVASVAPNAIQILRLFKKKKDYCPSRVNLYLSNLIRRGLILKDKNGRLRLSPKGELRLSKYQAELSPAKNKKWDKKWRIVIFDIWEKSRQKRDVLRHELSDFGFVRLQNSVWITPYECEEYINLLKTDVGIGKGVVYIVAEQIDDDVKFKKIFGLS